MGYTIPKIENGPLVRNGNTTNSNGMYGRVREDALERIFNIMKLKPTDVFIDLGHGIACRTRVTDITLAAGAAIPVPVLRCAAASAACTCLSAAG